MINAAAPQLPLMLMPQLLREQVLEAAIAPIQVEVTPEMVAQFWHALGLEGEAQQQGWMAHYGIAPSQLEALASRSARIQHFKAETFGPQVESHFLKRKRQLDRVVYSLIRTEDPALCQELYFRIQDQEQSFAEAARQYSQGPEAETYGVVGPVPMGSLMPQMAQALVSAQPAQLLRPMRLQNWFVILRLERVVPAQLTPFTRQMMLDELFEQWMQGQIQQLGDFDRSWFTPKAPAQNPVQAPLQAPDKAPDKAPLQAIAAAA
jgi:hypothetical protein